MAAMMAETSSNEMDAILQVMDDDARAAVFDRSWAKVRAGNDHHINIEALGMCVRLLPPYSPDDESVSTGKIAYRR
jgi:hypothetical protein